VIGLHPIGLVGRPLQGSVKGCAVTRISVNVPLAVTKYLLAKIGNILRLFNIILVARKSIPPSFRLPVSCLAVYKRKENLERNTFSKTSNTDKS